MKTECWCGGLVVREACQDSKFHDPFATGDPDKIERIYVAGPMTGYPECNYPEFNRVAKHLRSAGYKVTNPAEYGTQGHYVGLLREDLRLLLDCHAVAVLEGWWLSSGARNEVSIAGLLRMPVRPYNEWLDAARWELL